MIEENKSSQPEVKASKSDKRLLSYSHLKTAPICHQFWVYMDVFDICNERRRRLLVVAQPPTLKIFDIPDQQIKKKTNLSLAASYPISLKILGNPTSQTLSNSSENSFFFNLRSKFYRRYESTRPAWLLGIYNNVNKCSVLSLGQTISFIIHKL